MTPHELQTWLISDAVKQELERISVRTVLLEFDGISSSSDNSGFDWNRLLLAGSILARSSLRKLEESALRIATAAVLLGEESSTRDTGALLLEKLSNSRAVALAENRRHIEPELLSRLGVAARVEASHRFISQRVLEQFTGNWLSVNDFQEELWNAASLHKSGWLSASAPTAAGKTFLVGHWLIDTMLTSEARIAIYIAPTRALVSEIETSLKQVVRALNSEATIGVASLPLRETYEQSINGGKATVFVFTQERLHLLANVVGKSLEVDILVVDEAHKIGDGGRGVILQAAIERVSHANPKLRAVFISPATHNPELLLEDAPSAGPNRSIDSDVPTVLQNLITCSQVPSKSKEWLLKLRFGSELLSLGTLQLQHRPTNISKRIALISAAAAGTRGGTLVYANGAAEAEKIAVLISQACTGVKVCKELSDLADLARKGVHPTYQLANVVEKGVAFHYGNMPSLLRLEIERLFRKGVLKFLVCTSTLVEGVNLSCRTIVVRGPRKGRGHPMGAADFWNLAGRAGRWGDEFQGNIICIDPNDSKAWPDGVPERARYPILRETDQVMKREEDLEKFLAERADATPKQLSELVDLEQVSSYLLATYVRDGSIQNADFAKRHDAAYIKRLDLLIKKLVENVELPGELIARHPGVSAIGLQQLLSFFQREEGREETFIPEPPESDGAYGRISYIMQIVNTNLYPAFGPEARVPLYALVVIEWLKGYSLSFMIRKRIEYHKKRGQSFKIPEVIRSTMELVEQVARFRAPKYLAAYVDVLRFHLVKVGKSNLLHEDLDIAVALEFGISTRTLLSLMELGLSRMSAVALNEIIANDNLSQGECLQWVRSNQNILSGSDLPNLILREIEEVNQSARDLL